MGLKEILARRLTPVVLLLVIAGSIWWAADAQCRHQSYLPIA